MIERSAAELTAYVYEQVLAGRRATLEALLHDDFLLAGTREHIDRDGWVRLMLDETEWEDITVEQVGSDLILGNALVVPARVRYRGRRADDVLAGSWNVIDVWQEHGVDWKLLSRTTFPAA